MCGDARYTTHWRSSKPSPWMDLRPTQQHGLSRPLRIRELGSVDDYFSVIADYVAGMRNGRYIVT
eukprot:1856248-Amphidinium_carterae.1